jgi:hypothetical protein
VINYGAAVQASKQRMLRIAFSLMIMIPGWALLGAFSRLDSQQPPDVAAGLVVGALVGVFFGLVFGGAKGRWIDFVYGTRLPEGDDGDLECGSDTD